jgi:hypothetical protein
MREYHNKKSRLKTGFFQYNKNSKLTSLQAQQLSQVPVQLNWQELDLRLVLEQL